MPEPLESFVFMDFSGGLNTTDGPFELEDNEAQDLLNVTLTQRGSLKKRAGKVRFDSAGFPVDPAHAEHLRAWYPGTDKFLMASIDGDLFSFTTAGVGTQRINGTSPNVWAMEQMQSGASAEFLWVANGVDSISKISAAMAVTPWTNTSGFTGGVNVIRVWRNRMVFNNLTFPMRLHFSAIGDPQTVGANDFQDVKGSEEDVEAITWLEVLGDNLLVFKKNSVWSIYSEPPNIALKRLGSPGCEDRFQTCVVGNRAYWWGRNGVWSTDGVEAPIYESSSIESFILGTHNFAQAAKVRMCASRDRRVFVSLAIDGATDNNHVLEHITDLDQNTNSDLIGTQAPWVRHDLKVASMCTFRAGDVDKLLAGASDDNRIHTLFEGTDDDGVAINSFWWGSWKALYGEEPIERLRRLNFQMDGTLVVQVFRDFESIPVFTTTLTRPGSSLDPLWDGGLWDGGLWLELAALAGFVRARPESRGRYHSVRISNNHISLPMTIFSIEMMVRGGTKELHT